MSDAISEVAEPMTLNSIPWPVWLVPIALLLIAIAPLPYGYYTLLRIVVTAAAVLFVYAGWRNSERAHAWWPALAMMALLFNPLLPLHMPKGTWLLVNIGAAAVFAAHLVFVRLGKWKA